MREKKTRAERNVFTLRLRSFGVGFSDPCTYIRIRRNVHTQYDDCLPFRSHLCWLYAASCIARMHTFSSFLASIEINKFTIHIFGNYFCFHQNSSALFFALCHPFCYSPVELTHGGYSPPKRINSAAPFPIISL